jgi:hypothetical protein
MAKGIKAALAAEDKILMGNYLRADILSTNTRFGCKLFCIGQTENHRPI